MGVLSDDTSLVASECFKYKPTSCSQAGERTSQNDLSNLGVRKEGDPQPEGQRVPESPRGSMVESLGMAVFSLNSQRSGFICFLFLWYLFVYLWCVCMRVHTCGSHTTTCGPWLSSAMVVSFVDSLNSLGAKIQAKPVARCCPRAKEMCKLRSQH